MRFPGYSRDIVSFGMVSAVQVSDAQVRVELALATQDPQKQAQIEADVRKVLGGLPGVEEVTVEVSSPPTQRPARPQPAVGRREEELWTRAPIPGVKDVVAVGSGKGGVGKTTVAVNLAIALAQQSYRVGLLDADVHGPNVPGMLDLHQRPEPDPETLSQERPKILPLQAHGVKVISLGFFLDEREPVIWRGPLVGGLIQQFFMDVSWGNLDYLIVDLPPGTGDAQLSMVQKVNLSGAVIVTTPQDVALQDAMKGLLMFQKLEVPVLGIVENMSYFVCPHCGQRTEVFDHGGGEREAKRMGVPFLGEVPLDLAIRVGSDEGLPIVVKAPDSPQAQAFQRVAERLVEVLREREAVPAS